MRSRVTGLFGYIYNYPLYIICPQMPGVYSGLSFKFVTDLYHGLLICLGYCSVLLIMTAVNL